MKTTIYLLLLVVVFSAIVSAEASARRRRRSHKRHHSKKSVPVRYPEIWLLDASNRNIFKDNSFEGQFFDKPQKTIKPGDAGYKIKKYTVRKNEKGVRFPDPYNPIDFTFVQQNIPGLSDLAGIPDLTLQTMKNVKRPFIKKLNIVFASHELLSVCGIVPDAHASKVPANVRARTFIVDRGVLTMEANFDSKRPTTQSRIIYIGASPNCDLEANHQWPSKIAPEWVVVKKDGKAQTTIRPDRNSFNQLLEAQENYVLKYPNYKLESLNCQHFATGLYNALQPTNQSPIKTLDANIKEMFSSPYKHDDLFAKNPAAVKKAISSKAASMLGGRRRKHRKLRH